MSFSESITGFFSLTLGPFAGWNPAVSLLIISFILTFITTLIYKYTTDQQLMKSFKEESKKMQEEMKLLKDNPQKMMEKNKELMGKNMKMMRQSFKPLLYTFIPFAIIFFGLRNLYEPFGKILFGLSWIWIYILSSLIFNLILRKIMKVY
ncbi:MAG: EMC3/TMCO1 family protein [Nanoarchaeota archaeon]